MERDRRDQVDDRQMGAGAAVDVVPVDVLQPAGTSRPAVPYLLAVDGGLRTGLALFARDGSLLWYRSHHLANRAHLKRAVRQILGDLPGLQWLAVEGGGTLAEIWLKEAERRGIAAQRVQAERWRAALLLPRQQRSGRQAKQVADDLARSIIARSGAARPTALRHDAAEAILIGWWALATATAAAGSRFPFEKPAADDSMKSSPDGNGAP
jgi:hypothetical protein